MTLPAYSSSLPMTLLLAGFTRCTRWQAKQATLSYSSGSALSFSVPALDMSTNQTAPSLEFDRLTTNATPLSNVRRTMTMHKLATGGLLLAFLVLDSASEVLAQREGGAFWGPFAHGGSHGASTAPSGCAPGIYHAGPEVRPSRRGTPQNPELRGPGSSSPGLELCRADPRGPLGRGERADESISWACLWRVRLAKCMPPSKRPRVSSGSIWCPTAPTGRTNARFARLRSRTSRRWIS